MNLYLKTFLISFIVAILLFIFLIPLLRIIKFGQNIRDDGPSKHHKKKGTPTMGGIIIIASTIITYLFLLVSGVELDTHYTLLLIFPLLMYGSIGFIDDYLKVVKKNNKGLSSRTKMFYQIIWAGLYFYLFLDKGLSSKVDIFGIVIDLKWGYGILILLMLVGASNAVNLSDGLDGLTSGLMIISLLTVIVLSYLTNKRELLFFSLCLVGAILAFFCYNFNPAKVFMGDTGSLALGASLANLFILLKMEVLLIVVGFVFVLEALSDIVQVLYFKLTKGKRVFLMAPIHHHFELKGMNEWEVDALFWSIAIICGIVGIILGIRIFI